MSGFKLPWEESEIRQVIEVFQCKVMSIEEVKHEEMDDHEDRQR